MANNLNSLRERFRNIKKDVYNVQKIQQRATDLDHSPSRKNNSFASFQYDSFEALKLANQQLQAAITERDQQILSMNREIRAIQNQLSENGNRKVRPVSNSLSRRRSRHSNSFVGDRMAFSLRRVGRVAFNSKVEVREIDKNKAMRGSYFSDSKNLE